MRSTAAAAETIEAKLVCSPGPGLELPVLVVVAVASERRPCPSTPTFSMFPKCHLPMTQNPVYRAPPEKRRKKKGTKARSIRSQSARRRQQQQHERRQARQLSGLSLGWRDGPASPCRLSPLVRSRNVARRTHTLRLASNPNLGLSRRSLLLSFDQCPSMTSFLIQFSVSSPFLLQDSRSRQ